MGSSCCTSEQDVRPADHQVLPVATSNADVGASPSMPSQPNAASPFSKSIAGETSNASTGRQETPALAKLFSAQDETSLSRGTADEIRRHISTSSLHEAAKAGDTTTMKGELANGVDVNHRALDVSVTALQYAIAHGQIESARCLLEACADVHAKNDSGATPLHTAAEDNQVEVARLLLELRADLNAMDKREMTPLHWAARMGREEIVLLLLTSGAAVNLKNIAGYTPYAMSEDWGTANVRRLIESRGGTRYP